MFLAYGGFPDTEAETTRQILAILIPWRIMRTMLYFCAFALLESMLTGIESPAMCHSASFTSPKVSSRGTRCSVGEFGFRVAVHRACRLLSSRHGPLALGHLRSKCAAIDAQVCGRLLH